MAPQADVHSSLNRATLVDLPGVALPDALKRQTGYQLLSTPALARLVRAHAEGLRVDPSLDDAPLVFALNDRLDAGSAAAAALAATIGQRLGYFLLMLQRGDPVNRAARRAWDDTHWAHWAQARRIVLGGGVVAGTLGQSMVREANALLHTHGFSETQVEAAAHAPVLPLLGLARLARAKTRAAVLLDAGGTFVKRACAQYTARGEVKALHCLPALPAHCELPAENQLAHLVSIVRQTWLHAERTGLAPGKHVLLSCAAYLRDGRLLQPDARGCYDRHGLNDPDLQRTLTREVGTALAASIQMTVMHDGTAAALNYAGEPRTTVIMIGSALGVGFPPEAAGNMRALSGVQIVLAS